MTFLGLEELTSQMTELAKRGYTLRASKGELGPEGNLLVFGIKDDTYGYIDLYVSAQEGFNLFVSTRNPSWTEYSQVHTDYDQRIGINPDVSFCLNVFQTPEKLRRFEAKEKIPSVFEIPAKEYQAMLAKYFKPA